MYFFKDDSYYLFSGSKLDIEDGYPRLINEKWAFCTETIRQANSATHSSTAYRSILTVLCLLTGSVMLRLHYSS